MSSLLIANSQFVDYTWQEILSPSLSWQSECHLLAVCSHPNFHCHNWVDCMPTAWSQTMRHWPQGRHETSETKAYALIHGAQTSPPSLIYLLMTECECDRVWVWQSVSVTECECDSRECERWVCRTRELTWKDCQWALENWEPWRTRR